MNKFEVVSLFRSSRKFLSNLFVFVHFILFSVLVSGVTCDVQYWILKTNYLASRIKVTISALLRLFCFSCPCLSVTVLKYLRYVNKYFAVFVANYLRLAERVQTYILYLYSPEMKKIHSVLYIKFS